MAVGARLLARKQAIVTKLSAIEELVCGMTPVGRDSAKQNLLWLEYTSEQAENFLSGAR
jgi:hypothetical protein